MAIRLIIGRNNRGVDTCKETTNLLTVIHAVYIQMIYLQLRVAESKNRHITLHKRTGRMTNAETKHRHADSPSSRR